LALNSTFDIIFFEEIMLYRNIIKKLEYWKDNEIDKAFILKGAKQSGKTYIIDYFCNKNFPSFVSLNLLENNFARTTLLKCESVEDVMLAFSLIFPGKLVKNKTVIFIDEIEAVPELLTLVKGLVIEGSYRYLLCGSLLGITLRNIRSVPVGYASIHTLYPLNFEEFLIANGITFDIIEICKACIKEEKPLPESIYAYFERYWRQYLLVGGMPKVVDLFIREKDYHKVLLEQQSIIGIYLSDMSQYDKLEKKLLIERLYLNVPSQLKKEYNRFEYKDTEPNLKAKNIESSIDWLNASGCTYKINLTNDLSDGIIQNQREIFKLYLNDVGLLVARLGSYVQQQILSQDTDFNLGYLYENFACCELIQKINNLMYFHSKKMGEVDFVSESLQFNSIILFEIKSGVDFTKHNALDNVLKNYPKIKYSNVFAKTNIYRKDKILYLPIFCIGFIEVDDFIDY
jgi:predicted AAA+ superfamily ATPase